MAALTSETKTFIMGLLNDVSEQAKEQLYTDLHEGGDGVKEAKLLGIALRSKEDFERFVFAEEAERNV